jgi:hypothetical protein
MPPRHHFVDFSFIHSFHACVCGGRFVRELNPKKEQRRKESWGAEEKAVRLEQRCGNRKTERKKSGTALSFFFCN